MTRRLLSAKEAERLSASSLMRAGCRARRKRSRNSWASCNPIRNGTCAGPRPRLISRCGPFAAAAQMDASNRLESASNYTNDAREAVAAFKEKTQRTKPDGRLTCAFARQPITNSPF